MEILADWVTLVEDGYLTLRFRTIYGNTARKHFVNLISTDNPDNPYEVEFRHNAYGDTYGEWAMAWWPSVWTGCPTPGGNREADLEMEIVHRRKNCHV